MYAVIKTGGKQYKVSEGDVLRVEKFGAETGDVVAFDEVLMIGGEGDTVVGSPTVDGASVTANVLEVRKDKKVLVFKKRRRQNYRRKKGHRQWIAVVSVAEILKPGTKTKLKLTTKDASAPAKAEAKPAAKPAKKAEPKAEAAPKKAAAKPAAKPAAKKEAAGSDDLTQLTGVGPAFAKKLNEAGVTSFAQIAAWDEAEIARLDGEISGLAAKAEKGDWVAEAKKLGA